MPLQQLFHLYSSVYMRHRSLSQVQEIEVTNRYTKGDSLMKLANHYSVCTETIRKILIRNGVACRSSAGFRVLRTNKECRSCHRVLPANTDNFYKTSSGYLVSCCKTCHNDRTSEWDSNHHDHLVPIKRAKQRHRLYGWPPELFEETWKEQNGKCAICEIPLIPFGKGASSVHSDHDHRTGSPRGLLCARCNRALGGFDDSVDHLQAAIYYLSKHQMVRSVG